MADFRIVGEVQIDRSSIAREVRKISTEANNAFNNVRGIADQRLVQTLKGIGDTGSKSLARVSKEGLKTVNTLEFIATQATVTARRFIVYQVVAGLFFRLTSSIGQGAQAFLDFNDAIIKSKQILNPLTSDIDKLIQSQFDLANAFGVTVTQVQQAQETFIRQGRTQEEVTKLTAAALALSSAAGLDAAQATETLTSALNQYNLEASKALEIADKFTNVSIRNAVTVGDLDAGFRRAASAAKTVGVEINDLVGFISAIQEQTRRGGEVIGTSLRTIFTRLFRGPAIQAIEEVGISIRQLNGDFRSATDILRELSLRFNDLTRAQQLNIAATIAGQRQIASFIALVNNFDKAQKASNDALTASGTTAQLVQIRQEALGVQLQKARNQALEFGVAIGNAIGPTLVNTISGFASTLGLVAESLGKLNQVGLGGDLLAILLKGAFLPVIGRFFSFLDTRIDTTIAKARGLAKSFDEFRGARVRGNFLNQREQEPTRGIRGVFNAGRFEAEKASFDLAKQRTQLDQSNLRVNELKNQILSNQVAVEQIQLGLQANKLRLEGANLEFKVQAFAIEQRVIALQEEQNVLAEKFTAAKLAQRTAATAQKKIESEIAIIQERKSVLQERTNEQVRSRNASLRAIRRAEDGIAAAEARRLEIRRQIAQLSLERNDTAARKLVEENVRLLERESELRRNINDRQKQADAAALSRDERRAELAKVLTELKEKSVKLSEQENRLISTTTDRETLATQRRQQAGRITAQKNKAIALESKFLTRINEQLQNGNISRDRAAKLLNQQRILAQQLTETEAVRLANTQKVADAEARNTAAQERRNRRGGRAFGLAITTDIVGSLISKFIKDITDEGDKGLRALADGVGVATGSFTTFALLGAGPLGAIVGSVQALIGIIGIFKGLSEDVETVYERINSQLALFAQQLRAIDTIQNDIISNAKNLQNELSPENFRNLDASIGKLGETFTKLDASTLAKAAQDIRDASEDANFEGIRNVLADLRKQQTIKLVEAGELGALEDTNRLLDERDRIIGLIQTKENELRLTAAGQSPGIRNNRTRNIELDKQRDLLAQNAQALREQGQQAVQAFTAAIRPGETFDEVLQSVGGNISGTLRATNQLTGAFESFLRAQGLRIAGSPIKQAQIDAEASLNTLTQLQLKTGQLNNIKLSNLLLEVGNLDSTFGKSTATTFRLNDALTDNQNVLTRIATAFNREFPNATNPTGKALERINSLAERGDLVFTTFTDELGNTSTKLQGFGTTIDSNTDKGKLLFDAIEDGVDVLSLGVEGFESLRGALIPIDVLLEALTKRLETSTKKTDEFVSATKRLATAEAELLKIQQQSSALFPVDAISRANDEISRQVSEQSNNVVQTRNLRTAFSDLLDTAQGFDSRVLSEIADIAESGGDAVDVQNAKFESFLSLLGTLSSSAETSRLELEKLGEGANVQPLINSVTQLQTTLQAFQIGGNSVAAIEQFRQTLFGLTGQLDDELRTQAKRINETLEGQFKFQINLNADAETIRNQIQDFIDTISASAVDAKSPEFKNALRLFQEFITQETKAGFTEGTRGAQKNILNTVNLENLLKSPALKQLEPIKKLLDELGKTQVDNLKRLVDSSIAQLDKLAQAVASTEFTFPTDQIETALNKPFENVQSSVTVLKAVLESELSDVRARVSSGEGEILRLRGLQSSGEQVTQQLNDTERDLANDRRRASAITAELRVNSEKLSIADERRIGVAVAAERRFNTLFNSTIQSQDNVIKKELEASNIRFQLVAAELDTTSQRIAAIRAETAAADNLIIQLNDLQNVSLESLTNALVNVTKEVQSETNPLIREALKRESDFLRTRIDAIGQSNQLRVSALQKELDIIRQQEAAVTKLGLAFLTATEEQQKGFIESARLVDKFFGQLSSEDITGRRGTNRITDFVSQTTPEARAGVIEQLRRLESVGGEVAPGLSAGETLRRLGEVVGNAIFQSPQQAALERQEQIQRQILSGSLEQVNIAKVNLQVQQALLKLQQTVSQKTIESLAGREGEIAGGIAGEATGAIRLANESVKSVLGDNFNAAAAAIEDSNLIANIDGVIEGISKSNKDFVNAFTGVSTAVDENALSAEDLRTKIQELSAAILTSEERVGQAQVKLQDALIASADAMGKLTAANAEFILGQRLVEVEARRLFGTFTSVAEEAGAVNTVYEEQIRKLDGIFGAEQTLNELRVRLLEEQKTIFENALNEQLSLGESFFTASREERANLLEGFVGLENIVRDLNLAPGTVQNLGATELNEIGNSLLSLPDEFRQTLFDALDAVPGETAFGGVAADELRQLFAGSAFGAGGQFETPGDLQRQIIDANREIARLNTDQLLAAQQTVFNTQIAVQEAQNQVREAQAQTELLRLQIEAINQLGANVTGAVQAALLSNINRFGNAAGGHLSLPEARGLLSAASREKRASPPGSKLGVFNTSETVLTKGQTRKLFGLGRGGLNAQDGTAIVGGGEEIVSLLQQISGALSTANTAGGATGPIQIQIDNNRTVSVQGVAQLQTTLQDIFSSRTDELYTREEGAAIENLVQAIVQQLRETGQLSVLDN